MPTVVGAGRWEEPVVDWAGIVTFACGRGVQNECPPSSAAALDWKVGSIAWGAAGGKEVGGRGMLGRPLSGKMTQ
jgi:hypothetical protein